MGEAKDKKDSEAVATMVIVTGDERMAVAQLLDAEPTKGYEDRRKRRRVRKAFGIVPKVDVFKKFIPIDDNRSVVE
ncbi:hypothetical protein LCGC14_3049490, partial [marine sediment metagenome]